MPGLQHYVKREEPGKLTITPPLPPSSQSQQQSLQGRTDRIAAASQAKISFKRDGRPMTTPQAFVRPLSRKTPPPGYDSTPAAPRNTYPNRALIHQQNAAGIQQIQDHPGLGAQDEQHFPVQGGAFDDTNTSSLEDTRSDVPYNSERHMDIEEYDIQDEGGRQQYVQPGSRRYVASPQHHSKHLTQHALQHKQSRSPLTTLELQQQQKNFTEQQTHGIVGRFEAPANERWQQDIAHRNGKELDQPCNISSSPKHSSDPMHSEDRDDDAQHQSLGLEEDDSFDESESGVDSDLPTQQGDEDGFFTRGKARKKATGPRTNGVQSTVSAVNHSLAARDEVERALDARLNDPNRSKPDYDDEKLGSMAFADLKKESWDAKPSTQQVASKRANPIGSQKSEYTFEECMEYIVKDSTADEQVQSFEEMSIDEFEQAGDFFIGKFGELMKQIKNARRDKRKLVSEFEDKIEARETAVRGKSDDLDRQFNEMRAGGEVVLRGEV